MDTTDAQLDLRPAADALAALVRGVRDDQLDLPTPCTGLTVAALLDHVDGFAWALGCAARKESLEHGPTPDAAHLTPDWRTRIPDRLDTMVRAWSDPGAWEGRTSIGGIDQTAAETGYVGVDEMVVHGWDLARATGQPSEADDASLAAARRWVEGVASADGIPGLFGPAGRAPEDASPLEQLVALTGRDPAWRGPAATP